MDYKHLLLCYKLTSAMMTTMNNRLRPYHLTFQQLLILLYINEQSQDVVGKDICQYFGISHPTSVGLISRMQGASYIIAEVSQTDRRERVIYITPKGKEVVEQSRYIIDEYIENLKKYLSVEDQQDFIDLLLKLDSIYKMEKGR